MPNWCYNSPTIWCYNSLTITGDPKKVQKFVEEAIGFSFWEDKTKPPCKLQFNNHIPFPPGLIRAHTYKEKRTKDEMNRLYSDFGYSWERKHWGCKWGARRVELEYEKGSHTAHYTFETAWNYPDLWLKAIAVLLYPTLNFTLTYEEEMSAYKREIIFKQGKIQT